MLYFVSLEFYALTVWFSLVFFEKSTFEELARPDKETAEKRLPYTLCNLQGLLSRNLCSSVCPLLLHRAMSSLSRSCLATLRVTLSAGRQPRKKIIF